MGDTRDEDSKVSFVRGEISKLFRDLLAEDAFFDRAHFPVIDVIENKDSIRIEVEVPGLNKDEISLEVFGDTLVVEGNKRDAECCDRISYVCMERRFGYFKRAVMLPSLGDTSNIETALNNGVLTITLPKRKERRENVKEVKIE